DGGGGENYARYATEMAEHTKHRDERRLHIGERPTSDPKHSRRIDRNAVLPNHSRREEVVDFVSMDVGPYRRDQPRSEADCHESQRDRAVRNTGEGFGSGRNARSMRGHDTAPTMR